MKPTILFLVSALVAVTVSAVTAVSQSFADRFESNNSFAQAKVLEADEGAVDEPGLTIYPTGDVDFFKFTLPASGQAGHFIEIYAAMLHPILGVGRADISLLDAQGNSLSTKSTPLGSGAAQISLQGRAAGSYGLKVEGRVGSYGAYNLTISLPAAAVAPTITMHPQSQTVTAGASVTLSVAATGTPPLSYQWRKAGQPLPGQTSATLTLANVQAGDAGSYTVVVSNSAGQVTSTPALLTVNPAAVAPTITMHPQSQTVTAGASVTFSVAATGTPPLSYQWRKADQPLPGQTSATLTLANVQAGDAGSYTVVVSNSAGQVTSTPATLTVTPLSAPRHPADVNPPDNRLTLQEVIAYAAGYKRGQPWPEGPNPIPLDYMIRAATLYRRGEIYRHDPTAGSPPLWWVNTTPP